ncbi:MAG: ABC transporter ATP-binding protein [Chloroflexi bacterium]|nr:ABC transporter ATP-binding protein [Chloroflexota bacterium]
MSDQSSKPVVPKRIQAVQMNGIVKRFPGVLAVDHVDFELNSGEVHALLGENGAGKSTLMKILYGLYNLDDGEIVINGNPTSMRSPNHAIQAGIGMIHQHFMLVPSLTVAENIALGMRSSRGMLLDLDVVSARIRELSELYGLEVQPEAPIWQLAVGEQQRVEILRALYREASLLILDEPTAVLTPQEVDDLFRILGQMRDDGHSLVFISHKLHEVLAISNRITVLRDGRLVDTIPADTATKQLLAQMMVGREVVMRYEHAARESGESRLKLDSVSALSNRGDLGLRQVTLDVRAGEIVGVAGVSGNGQHELAQVIAGLRPSAEGKVWLEGQDVTSSSPAKLNTLGLSHIPEERMLDGIVKDFSVAENLVLQDFARKPYAWGMFLRFGMIARKCKQYIREYEIKTPSHETPTKSLSGGNIQKLVLARELSRQPRVLIAAQPTRGVDIGATEYIHHRLLEARDSGTAILLISEDLDEILALADRIVVMYEGQIVGEVSREDADVGTLGLMMAGATVAKAPNISENVIK